MKLTVSEKHIKLRIAVVIVSFIVAVTAFTIGVVNIGKKTPGYQLIEAKADAEAMTYNKAVGFRYYLEGSSNEIKRAINDLVELYTPILSDAYKQLDHQNVYTGQVSIGTINQNMGTVVSVSPELYGILKDAYARTLSKNGFNMFAGALYTEWRSIQILDEPDEFDPAFNEEQAKRISEIASEVSKLDNFKLEFLDDNSCSIRFSVSDSYRRFCEDHEISAFALDLNVLKDAYMLQTMAKRLQAAGCNMGYLYTREGMVLSLGSPHSLSYDMYSLENGREVVHATLQLDGTFSATTFTAFGYGSDYGYSIEVNGGKLFRNLYFNVQDGGFSNVVLSATVVRYDMDMVDTVHKSLTLANLKTADAVESYANSLGKDGVLVTYVLQDVL